MLIYMDAVDIAILAFTIMPITSLLTDGLIQIIARCRTYTFGSAENEDFTILVPIYGNIKYLENVDYLRQYGQKVTLCTTGDERPEFYQQLRDIADANGFRIFRDEPANSYKALKASERRATSGTIRDRLIRNALATVGTSYVVPLDADTTSRRSISKLIGELESHGWDIASVMIVPNNRNGSILTKLQYHEYRATMQLRLVAPWMISGACHVAKTAALRDIMDHHSLFFQGNDVEIGLIAATRGYKIGHIPFEIYTSVPATFTGWFRQRLAWAGGEFRLFITNFRFVLKHPLWWAYGGVIAIMLFPLRWRSFMVPLTALLSILISYSLLVMVIHIRTRDRWLLLMPFYLMFNSLVLTPLGILWYFKVICQDKNLGVIRPGRSIWRSIALRSKIIGTITVSLLVILAICGYVISNENRHYTTANAAPLEVPNGLNMLVNPGFEIGNDGAADRWYTEQFDTSGVVIYSLVTSGVVEGSYAQHISYVGTSGDHNAKTELFQGVYELDRSYGPGDVLTFSMHISGSLDKCAALIGIEGFQRDGGEWINEQDLFLLGVTDTPQQFSVYYELPPGCGSVAVYIQFNDIYPKSSFSITIDNAILSKTSGF